MTMPSREDVIEIVCKASLTSARACIIADKLMPLLREAYREGLERAAVAVETRNGVDSTNEYWVAKQIRALKD